MSAGAARPAPSRPRVESIWTFPEGYEVTARAATETATRLRGVIPLQPSFAKPRT